MIDIKMLPGTLKPTLVVLHEVCVCCRPLPWIGVVGLSAHATCSLQDADCNRHVKTYEIDVAERSLIDGPWVQPNVEAGATFIIPVPNPTPVRHARTRYARRLFSVVFVLL